MWWMLYRVAYAAALVWFAWFTFSMIANEWVTAESDLTTKLLFVLAAIGPPYGLWVLRRIVTGRWL